MRLDAVVLDFKLPDMDGRELARKRRSATPKPPLVVGYSGTPADGPPEEAGVDIFIQKPDTGGELARLFGPPTIIAQG